MQKLPQSDDTLLIRTDFSDEEGWRALWTTVTTPNEDGFLAHVHPVEDPDYRDLTSKQLVALAPQEDDLLIIADRIAIVSPEQTLLCVHITEERTESLRVIATWLWSIENNISIANMDWEEFAEAADDDGIFRGF